MTAMVLAVSLACGQGSESAMTGRLDSADDGRAALEENTALVRVMNALPEIGTVSLTADDSTVFGIVTYKMVTPYRSFRDRAVRFSLRADADTEGGSLARRRRRLVEGRRYTILAMPRGADGLRAGLLVLDDETGGASPGRARVRFVNAAPEGEPVDLMVRGRADPLFGGVAFEGEEGWSDVASMSGALEVRAHHTQGLLARLPNVKLESGRHYTFVFTGRPGRYEVIAVVDDGA